MHSFRDDRIIMFEPVSRQRRLARRRTLAVVGLIGLAAAAWIFGALTQTPTPRQPPAFSAFTSS
jgi:hypothetical protein